MPACDEQTDRQTDGRTDVKLIAITCFSIADARKNRQEACNLVYCTNRSKRLMEKKKTIEQSRVHEGSPME